MAALDVFGLGGILVLAFQPYDLCDRVRDDYSIGIRHGDRSFAIS